MPRPYTPDHRISEVRFRGPWFISCTCGFIREWSSDEVDEMEFGGINEEIEAAWLLHRREHGMTKK